MLFPGKRMRRPCHNFAQEQEAITEGITAVVNPDVCGDAGISNVPIQAIKFDEKDRKANVVKALCKGCEHALQHADWCA